MRFAWYYDAVANGRGDGRQENILKWPGAAVLKNLPQLSREEALEALKEAGL
jgi:hypothetical protein